MLQRLLFCLFIVFFILPNNMKASPIVGLDIALSDSVSSTIDSKMNIVLKNHPMLLETNKDSTQGIPQARSVSNKTGIFLISMILLFIFSLTRLLFPRYTTNLLQIFSGLTFSKRLIKEQLENDTRASFWFFCIYFLSTAFLVYQFFIRVTPPTTQDTWYMFYGLAVGFTTLLLILRIGLIRIIGWIFNGSEYVRTYLFNKKLVNEFAGLLLFPLCILILLSSGKLKLALLIITCILYIIMFAYSYIRNLSLLRNLSGISFMHFLLYICAFEVIPFLILLKIIR